MSGEPDVGTDYIPDYTNRYMTEAPFQYSDKLGDGIVLVRGDTFDEFVANMVNIFEQAGTDARLLGFASKQGSGDVISQAVTNLQNGGIASEPVSSTPEGRSCAHGKMTKRQGTSARGAWTGYFCPLQKGDPNQCKPVFV